MILVLFCVWEDARVWAHWNYSLDGHLDYLRPVSQAQNASCFSSILNFLRAHHWWADAMGNCLMLIELGLGGSIPGPHVNMYIFPPPPLSDEHFWREFFFLRHYLLKRKLFILNAFKNVQCPRISCFLIVPPFSPLSSLFTVLTHLLSYWGLGCTDDLIYSHKNICGELSAVPHSWVLS